MRLFYCILLIAITLFGCKNEDTNKKSDYAFLGGEVINPIDDFVIISKSKKNLDTLKLDGNNRFIYKINNLESGLFAFRLRSPFGLEYQMVLIEPNDSIMFRLNTLEFDESLVYTGEGAKKNNYLIEAFLKNEKEEKKVFKLCQLSPEEYQKEIDSLKSNKLKKLEKFTNKYDSSDLFKKIAQSNIEYSYYFNKEIYPFVHYGGNKKDFLESIPADFYSYRNKVNYNDTFLKDYFIYGNFLRWNFNNIALSEHYKHSEKDHFKSVNICYNLDRLALVDSLVSNTEIKEELLHHYTISFLNKSRNAKNNSKIVKYYSSISADNEKKEKVERYAKALDNLKDGSKFPKIALLDTNNSETSITSVINSPTVICFWSQSLYDHFKESQHKVNELTIKYPEVKFISINIDEYGLNSTVKALNKNRFSLKNQYQFKNPKDSKEVLAIYPMTKAFIVDKNQNIVNSKANIFAKNFEEQLLGLINR